MRFSFSTAQRIMFGPGTITDVDPLAKKLGKRMLIITGGTPGRAAPLLTALHTAGIQYVSFSINGEPTLDQVRRGTAYARKERCDVICGFGGGSAIDTAKGIAALLGNGGDPLDYMEVIGKGLPITRPSFPWIAIPTTAGSGAEVTSNAVIASPEHKVKASLRSPMMLASLVIVDPDLTHTLPPSVTASTGLDALAQLIEPYVSIASNPLIDSLCREGIGRIARSLFKAYCNGTDAQAREDMALASLFSGIALANAKLGAIHGIAGPLGGMAHAPHGSICARLLPLVMEANVRALAGREPDSPALGRYEEIARILTGNTRAAAGDGIAWLADLCTSLKIPPLSSFELKKNASPSLIQKAQHASSMQGNPVKLTPEEIEHILLQAL